MNSIPDLAEPAAVRGGSTRIVHEPAALTAIYDDAVSLCLYRPDSGLGGAEARAYAATALSTALRRDLWQLDGERPEAAALSELPEGAGRAAFVELLRDLAALYAALLGAERLGLRLSTLERAMCPRFHVDRVGVRLVYTVLGPGTEWLDSEVVDRRHLGHLAAGQPDECSGLIRPGGRVRRARAGDLCLLKGEAWPGNTGRGAVHRSPTPTPGERRVVVTLDTL